MLGSGSSLQIRIQKGENQFIKRGKVQSGDQKKYENVVLFVYQGAKVR
jgi:hypothetical protein